MNKRILKVIQIIATVGLLSLVFYQAGLLTSEGRERLISSFTNANLLFVLLSILLSFLINMSSSLKWYMLAQALQLNAGYWRLFAYYVIGQFYNLFLPTSVGGDVVRSYELGKFSGRQADSLASVFVERYTGVLTLLLVSGLAILSQISLFNVGFVIASLVFFALGLGFIAWVLFDMRLYDAVKGLVTTRLPFTQGVFIKLDKLLASIHQYRQMPRVIVMAFINSMVFYFIAVVNVYVTALVFQMDVSFVDILIATPIIMLIMNIPLSVGNIGLMEFAYINVLQLLGYPPSLGLSIAILMRLKSLLDGVLGGVLHPIFVTQKHE